MLTAVWIAIIAAVAFWGLAVCAGVFVMLRAARLISQTSGVMTGLQQRSEALMDEADAVTRRANEQVTNAEAITASMNEVTSSMAELNGRLTELAPAARSLAQSAALPLTKVAAVAYGVARAIGMRRAGGSRGGRSRGAQRGLRGPAQAAPPQRPVSRRRNKPALAGRNNEVAR